MTTYARGRVALTPAYECNLKEPAGDRFRWERTHVGHVRTLMLGQLICAEHGIPYHIRLDGVVRQQSVYNELLTGDRGYALLDIFRCLNHFQVQFDEIYQIGQEMPPQSWLEHEVGAEAAGRATTLMHTAGFTPEYYQAGLLDDSIIHAPSLIIRGREFVDGGVYWDAMQRGNEHVHCEDALFAALGREKHEVSTPMILLGRGKMSKSDVNFIHWTALEALPKDLVWQFLVATALCPEDPFSALEEKFEVVKLSKVPYTWSWSDWTRLAKMS